MYTFLGGVDLWRKVLVEKEAPTRQYADRAWQTLRTAYFFPAIIYRDIISHITITYRYIMYFFRTFTKSTAPYKVHNMGLRYIITINIPVVFMARYVMGPSGTRFAHALSGPKKVTIFRTHPFRCPE